MQTSTHEPWYPHIHDFHVEQIAYVILDAERRAELVARFLDGLLERHASQRPIKLARQFLWELGVALRALELAEIAVRKGQQHSCATERNAVETLCQQAAESPSKFQGPVRPSPLDLKLIIAATEHLCVASAPELSTSMGTLSLIGDIGLKAIAELLLKFQHLGLDSSTDDGEAS